LLGDGVPELDDGRRRQGAPELVGGSGRLQSALKKRDSVQAGRGVTEAEQHYEVGAGRRGSKVAAAPKRLMSGRPAWHVVL
jgi:hypothetical protein